MRPSRPLRLEALEARDVPTVFGVPWPDASHLTLSFAPDGTTTASDTSHLYAQLGGGTSSTAWQLAVLRAFQTWAVYANINFGLVADDGSAFGGQGTVQGAAGAGDIRVGSALLDSSQLAVTTPFNGPTGWSGDVLLNSAKSFSPDGSAGGYDLFTVALHEAGHVLGIGDSTDPSSVMYADYLGPRSGPSQADVVKLLALYSPRVTTTAVGPQALSFASDTNLAAVDGQLNSAGQSDYYQVTAPTTGTFTVALRTAGLSLLEARLTVLGSGGKVLATAQAGDPRQGDLAVTIDGQAGATYTIRVDGPSGDVFAIGSYRLAAGTAAVQAVKVQSTALLRPDGHGNDGLASATVLQQRYTVTDTHNDYFLQASLEDSRDIDVYRVQTPQNARRQHTQMAINVWALNVQTISPVVTVLDEKGRVVASQVVFAGGGVYSLLVPDVKERATYFVVVGGEAQPGWSGVGNYALSIDFQGKAAPEFTQSGRLDSQNQQDFRSLVVQTSQLFHFELTAKQDGDRAPAGVQMVIFDANNNVVFSTAVLSGAVSVNDVWLAAGTYTVRFWAFSTKTGRVGSVAYTLLGYGASDPIGLTPVDSTMMTTTTTTTSTSTTTSSTTTTTSTSTSTSTSTTTTTTDTTYYWTTLSPTTTSTLVGVFDPTTSSWWL